MPSTLCDKLKEIILELPSAIDNFDISRKAYLAAKEGGEEKAVIAEAAEAVDKKRSKIKELIHDAADLVFRKKFEGKNVEYRTIIIGGKTPEELEKDLDAAVTKKKMEQVTDHARSMIQNKKEFKTFTKSKKLDLVILSVADMDLPDNATRKEIYEKATKLGLITVPAEAGSHFRLQYIDQPKYQYLIMGMEPIAGGLFVVLHDLQGRWLGRFDGGPDSRWLKTYQFVFARGE